MYSHHITSPAYPYKQDDSRRWCQLKRNVTDNISTIWDMTYSFTRTMNDKRKKIFYILAILLQIDCGLSFFLSKLHFIE